MRILGIIPTAEKEEEPNTTALWIECGTQRIREQIFTEKHAGTRSMEVAALLLNLSSYRPVTYTGDVIILKRLQWIGPHHQRMDQF